jgi:NitT/TauT family transport system substrate-binding protein
LLFTTACSDTPPLNIGSNQWPGYEPFYLARELGLLRRQEVNLVELPSSTDVMQHLRNQNLDGGMLTLDEVLTLLAEGLPLRVILVMDISHGADTVLAQPEIKSLADIKGKRVGVELSGLGALMLECLLGAADLSPEEIEIVPLTVDQHVAAFIERQVDLVITFEPNRHKLLSRHAVELINSSLIPGRIIDVLAVRAEALEEHPDQLKSLIEGYFSARRYMIEQPVSADKKMAPRLGLKHELLPQIFKGLIFPSLQENREWLDMKSPRLKDSADQLVERMLVHKLIPVHPNLERLADGRFLPEK